MTKVQVKSKECKECGASVVPHRVQYLYVAVGNIANWLFPPRDITKKIFFKIQHIEHLVAVPLFHACVWLGVARKQREADDDTQLLALMLWNEAKNRNIEIWEFRLFGLPRNIFVAKFPNGKHITYEGVPVPPRGVFQEWWLDDKAILKERFLLRGIPVAKGGAVYTKTDAMRLFKNLVAPVIVKPRNGSGSRHTTLHIFDKEELLRAFAVATQISPAAVIEEELTGTVYRATVVDGKLAAVLRRDPPYVVGDGVHTIAELVNEANKHPARSGPYFSKIKIDDSAMNELKWHGHTTKDVLPKGKRVTFHQKVNWSVGGTTADVTDEVHSDNMVLFEYVAEVLKAPLVGIDFIIKDINRSWKAQERCGVIECNSMPFFDNHHLPFEGKPRNVAGAIWDMVGNQ